MLRVLENGLFDAKCTNGFWFLFPLSSLLLCLVPIKVGFHRDIVISQLWCQHDRGDLPKHQHLKHHYDQQKQIILLQNVVVPVPLSEFSVDRDPIDDRESTESHARADKAKQSHISMLHVNEGYSDQHPRAHVQRHRYCSLDDSRPHQEYRIVLFEASFLRPILICNAFHSTSFLVLLAFYLLVDPFRHEKNDFHCASSHSKSGHISHQFGRGRIAKRAQEEESARSELAISRPHSPDRGFGARGSNPPEKHLFYPLPHAHLHDECRLPCQSPISQYRQRAVPPPHCQ